MSKIKSESGSATRSDGKSNATITTASSSSLSSKRSKANWINNRGTIPIVIKIFKGANSDLRGKVFIVGPSQASKYDEAYKALLTYLGAKFDHKVHRAFEHKDAGMGTNMLHKPDPSPPPWLERWYR